jgi:hypothetical protein
MPFDLRGVPRGVMSSFFGEGIVEPTFQKKAWTTKNSLCKPGTPKSLALSSYFALYPF